MVKHLLWSLVFVPTIASATDDLVNRGDQRGNGGGAIVCRDSAGKPTSVVVLDVYEAAFREMELDFGPATDNPLDIVNKTLDRLKRIDPVASEKYRQLANSFFDPSVSRFKEGITLPFTEDTGPVAPPLGCSLEQVVLQLTPLVPEDRLFLVNKELFNAMDVKNKAALILHEVIYNELIDLLTGYRERIHQTSFYARYFNEVLLSKDFENMSIETYIATFGNRKIFVGSEEYPLMACENHAGQWRNLLIDFCKSLPESVNGVLKMKDVYLNKMQTEVILPSVEISTDATINGGPWLHIAINNMTEEVLIVPTTRVKVKTPKFLFAKGVQNLELRPDFSLHQLDTWFGPVGIDYRGRIEFDASGNPVELRETARVYFRNSFGGKIQVGGDGHVEFASQGQISVQYFDQADDYYVSLTDIYFRHDYSVSTATIRTTQPFQLPNQVIVLKGEVKFYNDRKLLSGTLAEDATLTDASGEAVKVKAGTFVSFSKTGQLVPKP